MKITIELPDVYINQVLGAFFNKFGAEMRYDQLIEFFKSDIVQVYTNELDNSGEDGLVDALDMFIAD